MRAALLIAAHDEATSIGDTIRHLAGRADSVYLIADHCTDATASLAAKAGARVYERDCGAGGKGAALAWFAEVAAEELDACDIVVILDADSRINDGFVPAIAERFARGAHAVQAFVHPSGVGRSPAAAIAAYSELLSQQIGDKIRQRLGWPVPLRGTGMALRPSLLREVVRGLCTRTEDIEMSLRLAQMGVRVEFVPGAVLYDPKPESPARASRQRARWLQGQAEVWRLYWRSIVGLALRGGPPAWALLWALLAKPKTLLTAAKLALLAVLLLLPLQPLWLAGLLRSVAGLALAVDAAYYLSGLLVVKERRFFARALLLSPLYLLVWGWSVLLAPLSRGRWLRARD